MIPSTCAEILVTLHGRHVFATDSAIRHYTDEQVAEVVKLLKTLLPAEDGYRVVAYHRSMQQSDILDEANAFDPRAEAVAVAHVCPPPPCEPISVSEVGWDNPRLKHFLPIQPLIGPRQCGVFPCHDIVGQFET